MPSTVKEERTRLDLSRPALARRADVSEATITRIERDPGYDPRVSNALRIARALGSTVEELFDIEDDGTSASGGVGGFTREAPANGNATPASPGSGSGAAGGCGGVAPHEEVTCHGDHAVVPDAQACAPGVGASRRP
ncbi:MAG: helix-turn-helix domain-containing protein [Actinomycetota bacterium]